jgi:hypothetical protein
VVTKLSAIPAIGAACFAGYVGLILSVYAMHSLITAAHILNAHD